MRVAIALTALLGYVAWQARMIYKVIKEDD